MAPHIPTPATSLVRIARLLAAALILLATARAGADVGNAWTIARPTTPWSGGTARAVTYNNQMWVATNSRQLWSSSNGTSWTMVSPAIPAGDGFHFDLVVFNNKLWAVAVNNINLQQANKNCVLSTTDGKTWTAAATAVPWRSGHANTTVVFNNQLFVVGVSSAGGVGAGQEVYSSSDGVAWTQVTPTLPQGVRIDPGVIVFNGKIWMLGGKDNINYAAYAYHCDAWSSSDGKTWHLENGKCDWYQRKGMALFAPDGMLWLACGSYQEDVRIGTDIMGYGIYQLEEIYLPTLWSSWDGIHWTYNPPDTPFTGNGVLSVAYDNKLWLIQDKICYSVVSDEPPPTLTLPAFSKGNTVIASWTALHQISGYNIQRAETPDFANPLESANVNTATLQRGFGNLADGKTYWYRVRGKKLSGLTSAWSAPVSCTQDATAPAGWITQNYASTDWPMIGAARVCLGVGDRGTQASGISQMRFSADGVRWSPWQPYALNATAWIGRTGNTLLRAQVSDHAGNVADLATTVTVSVHNALFVDCNNTTGPWMGTLEHPYLHINSALFNDHEGDVIVVAPGTYKESIRFGGNNAVLRSIDPQSAEIVKTTVIDAQNQRNAVYFNGTESTATVLAGFTIINGKADPPGYYDEDPITHEPILTQCNGGGIQGNGTHASLFYNRIMNNIAGYTTQSGSYYDDFIATSYSGSGGGIAGCQGLIANNIIANNTVGTTAISSYYKTQPAIGKPLNPEPPQYVDAYNLHGAALFDCNGTIVNNTIWSNHNFGVSYMLEQCRGVIRDNIIDGEAHAVAGTCSSPTYCAMPGWPSGGLANLTADPRLADPAHGDFHLLPDSPCIDAGMFIPGLLRDIDGEARGLDSTTTLRGDGSHFDIGADEYHPASPAVLVLEPHGGESLKAQDVFRIQVAMDPARAGERVRLELRDGCGRALKTWSFPAPGGNLLIFQHLPDVDGAAYSFRAISDSNTLLFDQSPPFEIRRFIANAVAPSAWRQYK